MYSHPIQIHPYQYRSQQFRLDDANQLTIEPTFHPKLDPDVQTLLVDISDSALSYSSPPKIKSKNDRTQVLYILAHLIKLVSTTIPHDRRLRLGIESEFGKVRRHAEQIFLCCNGVVGLL